MGKKKQGTVSDAKAEDQKQTKGTANSLEAKIAEDRKAAPKPENGKKKTGEKASGAKKPRVVSAASAKSFAAKRLAMAMSDPKRGWKETKPGVYEKGAHSVSFNTDGHFVEVDGQFQLQLGQGAIKLLDKHLEADAAPTPPAS